MKHLRFCSQLGALTLVVAAAWVALLHPYKATANDGNPRFGDGASYLTTVTDSNGNFRTRTVITLHADHTMSVVDADSGGPNFFSPANLARGDLTARVRRLEGRLTSIFSSAIQYIQTGMSHALITRLASQMAAV